MWYIHGGTYRYNSSSGGTAVECALASQPCWQYVQVIQQPSSGVVVVRARSWDTRRDHELVGCLFFFQERVFFADYTTEKLLGATRDCRYNYSY